MQRQKTENLKTLTGEAKLLFALFKQAEESIGFEFDNAVDRAWEFGKRLNRLKGIVGHGNWAKWREDSFPGLDDRKAQSCQALDRDNPNARNSADLNKESIRKFRYGYVPVKERKALKGDKTFARPSHHSSVVVECNKLAQRIDAGQYAADKAELRRDFRAFYEWLGRLYAQ
jgi:hypothetical protein